jgi:hypothetical protein
MAFNGHGDAELPMTFEHDFAPNGPWSVTQVR